VGEGEEQQEIRGDVRIGKELAKGARKGVPSVRDNFHE